MNKLRLILILTLIAIFLLTAPSTFSKGGKPLKGQVVVKTTTQQFPDSLVSRFKGKVKGKVPGKRTFLIQFPEVVPTEVVIRALEKSPTVEFAEPNYEVDIVDVFQISISSPDQLAPPLLYRLSPLQYYGQQTNLNIGLESAHILSTGEKVTVAVIDNGLDFDHPLFQDHIDLNGFDFVDNDSNPSEEAGTVLGHGTFVSGLVLLVAPNCKIMPIRSFNGNGQGSTFSIIQGLYHAIQQNVSIINMSFGTENNSRFLDSAVAAAVNHGITLVASSGNNGNGQAMYPASYPGVIAVSAVDTLQLAADFSNYGEYIDVCAPGVKLYSSLAGQYEWGWWSGTSFSASVVSGVAALVISKRAGLSAFDVEFLFRNTSRTNLVWGSISAPDPRYGYGEVDAFKSLAAFGRGDINNTGRVEITDLTKYVDYFFRGGDLEAWQLQMADLNCDNSFNILDFIGIVDYVFRHGELIDPCW